MAEKKKSPSTARPRGNKPAPAASPAVAAPVAPAVPAAPSASASTPVAAAPVAAPAAPAAPTALAGLEVDERPTIQMPAPPQSAPQHVPHDAIAQRAHEIHRARGGTAFDNWLQAERELGAR